jgi:hypothetical protein
MDSPCIFLNLCSQGDRKRHQQGLANGIALPWPIGAQDWYEQATAT